MMHGVYRCPSPHPDPQYQIISPTLTPTPTLASICQGPGLPPRPAANCLKTFVFKVDHTPASTKGAREDTCICTYDGYRAISSHKLVYGKIDCRERHGPVCSSSR
jgi:hypothetical protein